MNRFVLEEEAEGLRAKARRLPQLALDGRETLDLELIASGAASPLAGFLAHRDYRSVLEALRLSDGTPWPIPFTLAVTLVQMAAVLRCGAAALRDGKGRLLGTIEAEDTFVRSPRDEALALYGTDDPAHPGVAYLLARPTGLVGGRVRVLPLSRLEGRSRPSPPREIRSLARRRRWSGLAGLATAEGEGCLEPLGSARPALLAVPRVAVRHAPGRDAMLQAIVLKNHGAREVFLECDRGDWLVAARGFGPEELGIMPLWMVRPGAGPGTLHA